MEQNVRFDWGEEEEMSDFLKPYVCTQCGGKVNPATLRCEMCGTVFKDASDRGYATLQVVHPGAHTLVVSREIDDEMFMLFGAEEVSKRAIEDMAHQFAKTIAPFMTVRTEQNPYRHTTQMRGMIRVLDPEYRF